MSYMYNVKETTFRTKNKDKKLKRKICIFCIFFSVPRKQTKIMECMCTPNFCYRLNQKPNYMRE
jgi:hypothetical protein